MVLGMASKLLCQRERLLYFVNSATPSSLSAVCTSFPRCLLVMYYYSGGAAVLSVLNLDPPASAQVCSAGVLWQCGR